MLEKIAGGGQPVRRAVRQGGAAGFFYADPARAAKLLKERNELEPIAEAYTALRQAQQEQEEARELLAGGDRPGHEGALSGAVSVRQGNGSQITGKVENSAAAQGSQ